MVVDATNIATSGNVAAAGYQASRLGAANEPEDLAIPESSSASGQDGLEHGGSGAKGRGQVHMTPIFRFNSDAQRMVMLSRDPDTGTVLFQIPSEEALRQYEQALKRKRAEAATSDSSKKSADGSQGETSSAETGAGTSGGSAGAAGTVSGSTAAGEGVTANTERTRQDVSRYTARGRSVGSAAAGTGSSSGVRFSVIV